MSQDLNQTSGISINREFLSANAIDANSDGFWYFCRQRAENLMGCDGKSIMIITVVLDRPLSQIQLSTPKLDHDGDTPESRSLSCNTVIGHSWWLSPLYIRNNVNLPLWGSYPIFALAIINWGTDIKASTFELLNRIHLRRVACRGFRTLSDRRGVNSINSSG